MNDGIGCGERVQEIVEGKHVESDMNWLVMEVWTEEGVHYKEQQLCT